MPNWCGNKIEITGDKQSLHEFKKTLSGQYNSKKTMSEIKLNLMMIYILSEMQHTPANNKQECIPTLASFHAKLKQSILKNSNNDSSMVIIARAILKLSIENPDMDNDTFELIDKLYKESGIENKKFNDLTELQKENIKNNVMLKYFIYEVKEKYCTWDILISIAKDKAFKQYLYDVDVFRFENYITPKFNLFISGVDHNFLSGENYSYKSLWGTRKDSGAERIIDTGNSIVIQYSTAWSPSRSVESYIASEYDLDLVHSYMEEGNNFCGKTVYDGNEVISSSDDSIKYKEAENEEEEELFEEEGYEIIAPDYAVTFYDMPDSSHQHEQEFSLS